MAISNARVSSAAVSAYVIQARDGIRNTPSFAISRSTVDRPAVQGSLPPWTAPGWNLPTTPHPLVAATVEQMDAMTASQAFSSWIRAPRSSAHSSAHALSSSICRGVSPYAV